MTDVQERRDQGTHRVTCSTLVEVCGNVPGTPVFEAESIDVSPRGMHLKTAYLPEQGAPLVCRFENDGGEIVVEGVVAWRREGGRGGEFGVQFTALDSRSVDALRDLCGAGGGRDRQESIDEAGARVRLHIDGLGSPMKARVRSGNVGKVQVGSNLEFLKVGRRLEIEDMERGARRTAQIDGVSVLVDPSTQIPQLVVALRYEGADDDTPSPTVAEAVEKHPAELRGTRIPAESVTMSRGAPPKPVRSEAPASAAPASAAPKTCESPRLSEVAPKPSAPPAPVEVADDEPALRGRVATMAASAEVHAKAAGEKLASASESAARGAARWFKGAADKVIELGKKRTPTAARRTTSPPPAGASSDKPKLRSQTGGPATEASPTHAGLPRLTRRTGVAVAAIGAVAITAGAIAMGSRSAPPPGANAAASPSALAAVDAQGAAVGATEMGALNGAVTAHVPLFGPTPLTTTEPAPLGPVPGGVATDEQQELAEAKASLRASVEDDAEFPEEKPKRADKRDQERAESKANDGESKSAPEDVAPWGRGRMHLPTIHRLRLDAPGAAIQGAAEPTGFTIVIPDRKVMEAAGGIAGRDARIARVRATNIGAGAQVSFRFKDGVPGYRVRLRRDYIEFLVSSPTESEKAAETGTKAKKGATSTTSAKAKPAKSTD